MSNSSGDRARPLPDPFYLMPFPKRTPEDQASIRKSVEELKALVQKYLEEAG